MSSEDNDWIFDYVLQFLNSETFDAAVMDFVDEKCSVFDNEDENKLVYSEIHIEFKDHVEAVLTSNLENLGLTSEIFFQACVSGRNSRNVNKAVYDKVIAMDDFLTFKKIMVKRNTELELELMKAYRNMPNHDSASGVEEDEEDEELQAALRESAAIAHMQSEPEEPFRDGFDESEEVSKEDELRPDMSEEEVNAIFQKSLLDIEVRHKQEEMEQLELEQAIAVSLALEEERMRQLTVEMNLCNEAEAEAEERWPQDGDFKAYQGRDSDSQRFVQLERFTDWNTSQDEVKGQRQAIVDDEEDEGDVKGQGRGASSAHVVEKKVEEDFESTVVAPAKGEDDEVVVSVSAKGGDKHDDEPRARKKKVKKLASKPTLDVPEPKPLKLREFRALPEISKQVEVLEKKAKDIFQRNQEVLAEHKVIEAQLRDQVGLDDNESEAIRRAKYMREQRDRLISMKKAEREAKIRQEEELRSKAAAEKPRSMEGDVDFVLSQQSKGESKEEDSVAERKRAAMRNALARRMKQELLESSEAMQAKAQEDQFSELDRQLRHVEATRRENQQREMLLADQVRRQHEAMAKNVQRSAANMRQS